MARITVEDCLDKENNRFSLILLASKRAKQLLDGAPLLLEKETDNKQVVNALREIAAGKVSFMSEDDLAIRRAKEEQEKLELLEQQKQREAEQKDLGSELFENSDGDSSESSDDSEESSQENSTPA